MKNIIVKWGIPIVAHGIAWGLAAWLTMEQPLAEEYGGQLANALGAVILVVCSIIDSIRGRQKVKGK